MSVADLVAPELYAAFVRDLLAKIGETTPDLIFAKDVHSRMIFANEAVLKVLGKTWTEIRGRSDLEWHDDPVEARQFMDADARIISSGVTERLEEVLTGAVDGQPQTYLSTKSPLRAPDGEVIGLVGISMNITERKQAEQRRKMQLNELDHRMKNMFAVVQAMARQTLRRAVGDSEIWDVFEGRLLSMSQAHDVLMHDSWIGADLGQIVAEGLKAHGGEHADCFTIEGPPAWVDARVALALAMAFHELGTNAIKYGALSRPEGRVSILWSVERNDGPGTLDLHWRESGGPTVIPPTRRGFGSRLIEQAFGHSSGEVAKVDYRPEGVEFHVRFDLPVKPTDRGVSGAG